MIDKPGVFDISTDAYHADPVAEPSLSRGVLKVLLSRSPRHAWCAHPRLNPDCVPDDSTKFDLGKAAHRLLLGGDEALEVIDADDYRKKETRAIRAAALAAGKLPILADKLIEVEAMVAAFRSQIAQHHEAADAFAAGKPEQTLVWQEGGVWCRARLDWLPDDLQAGFFDDYKTTTNASPDAWSERVAWETGCHLQAAFYARGIKAVLGVEQPRFRFIVQEVEPPHALCVCMLTPGALEMADREVERGLEIWRECMRTGRWPGYPARICHVGPPPWRERRMLEDHERYEIARAQGRSIPEEALHWQAPDGWTPLKREAS